MREPGELSITETAERLGCHPNTVRLWALERLSGGASRLNKARRDVTGHIWIPESEVDRILCRHAEADYS